MPKQDHLNWPFFDPHHRLLASELDRWSSENLQNVEQADLAKTCRRLVRKLGDGGWLRHAVAGKSYRGASDTPDVRTLCLMREGLAQRAGLAVSSFAMQRPGSGATRLFGDALEKQKYPGSVAEG